MGPGSGTSRGGGPQSKILSRCPAPPASLTRTPPTLGKSSFRFETSRKGTRSRKLASMKPLERIPPASPVVRRPEGTRPEYLETWKRFVGKAPKKLPGLQNTRTGIASRKIPADQDKRTPEFFPMPGTCFAPATSGGPRPGQSGPLSAHESARRQTGFLPPPGFLCEDPRGKNEGAFRPPGRALPRTEFFSNNAAIGVALKSIPSGQTRQFRFCKAGLPMGILVVGASMAQTLFLKAVPSPSS